MSKVFVTPMGGGSGGGLEKLWEGDVHLTGSTDDLTGGAVDPTEYAVLLVALNGTVTAALSEVDYIGLGRCKSGSLSGTYDLYMDRTNTALPICLARQYERLSSGSFGTRNTSTSSGAAPSWNTIVPFLFAACKKDSSVHLTSDFTADLHVAVYGLKL